MSEMRQTRFYLEQWIDDTVFYLGLLRGWS